LHLFTNKKQCNSKYYNVNEQLDNGHAFSVQFTAPARENCLVTPFRDFQLTVTFAITI
jgi:hypothetical protein